MLVGLHEAGQPWSAGFLDSWWTPDGRKWRKCARSTARSWQSRRRPWWSCALAARTGELDNFWQASSRYMGESSQKWHWMFYLYTRLWYSMLIYVFFPPLIWESLCHYATSPECGIPCPRPREFAQPKFSDMFILKMRYPHCICCGNIRIHALIVSWMLLYKFNKMSSQFVIYQLILLWKTEPATHWKLLTYFFFIFLSFWSSFYLSFFSFMFSFIFFYHFIFHLR